MNRPGLHPDVRIGEVMPRRVADVYLWTVLLLLFLVGGVRGLVGPGASIAACVAIVALAAAAVWKIGAAKTASGRVREQRAFLPGVLLISGPILLFIGTTTGPPTPANPDDYLFNTTGLLLGVLIMFLGFAALSAQLWERDGRTWSVLGFAGLLVGVVLYAANMIFRYAQIAAGATPPFVEAERQVFPGLGNISLPLPAEPSWPAFLWVLFTLMLATYAVTAYLAAAAYGAALLRAGWVGKAGGTVFVVLGLALGLVVTLGWFFLSNPVVETLIFFLGVPFMSVILPYFLGVALIRHGTSEAHRTSDRTWR